jgi:hypothetical protein
MFSCHSFTILSLNSKLKDEIEWEGENSSPIRYKLNHKFIKPYIYGKIWQTAKKE